MFRLEEDKASLLQGQAALLEEKGCTSEEKRYMHYYTVNPSNAEATFVKSTRTQRFMKTI